MRNALERIVDHWRHFGLRGMHLRVLAGLSLYREMPVYRLDFPDGPPVQASPLRITRLRPQELDEYEAAQHATPGAATRFWMLGATCFVAWSEGRIVSSVWAAERTLHLDYLGRDLELSTDEVYFFEAFTTSEFRGRGLMGSLLSYACQDYRAQGRCRAYTVVFRYNRPSVRTFQKAGFRPHSIEGFRQFGLGRRPFTKALR